MKKPLILPKFKNEDEERDFWDSISLADYADPEDLVPVSFPNLRPTSHPISIRIPDYILVRIKERANAMNVPYQSLIKTWMYEKAFPDSSEVWKVSDSGGKKRKKLGKQTK